MKKKRKQRKVRGWHAKQAKDPHPGIGAKTVEALADKRSLAAIKEVLQKKPRDLTLFIVGVNTGLRAADLLRLTYKDVLTANGKVTYKLSVTERKTNKRRHIALGARVRQALKSWLSVDDYEDTDYVFPSQKGGHLSVQRLHQLVNSWCKQAKVKGHFGTHTLRKTYGYWLYAKGTDITLLMRMFGHSTPATTLRYIGMTQKSIDEANIKLNL